MLSTKDVTIVYETLLSSPGMNDAVKVDLRIPRKMVLLLTKAIELGLTLAGDTTQNGLLAITDAATAIAPATPPLCAIGVASAAPAAQW